MARRFMRLFTPAAIVVALTLAGEGSVWAERDGFEVLAAVADQELDMERGGFVTGGGMDIAFGIERAVLVDGVLQTSTILNIPSLATLSRSVAGEAISPVLSGGAPSMDTSALSSLMSGLITTVQNTLDRRVIDNITIISASVTALQHFREMQLAHAINSQLIDALR